MMPTPPKCAEALLGQKELITNWDDFSIANGIVGWSNETLADVCSWTGITCDETTFMWYVCRLKGASRGLL